MNKIINVIKDFIIVWKTRNILLDSEFALMLIILGMSTGTCLASIRDYNTIGLAGWLVITIYWFIEISKLNSNKLK